MLQRFLGWLREWWSKMIGTADIKSALNIDITVSEPMNTALAEWAAMYSNSSSWITADIRSLNLPAAIASEIARATTIEMAVEISGSARATFLAEQFKRVLPQLREKLEYGNAKGGIVFKPYPYRGGLAIDYVQADMFIPTNFDANGDITACIFSDQRRIGDTYYTRLEYHNLTDAGYFVKNVAFKSSTKDTLGSEVPLTAVAAWAGLVPEATITGIDKPLFAYYRYPSANSIDPSSPLGVSCYARAVTQIEDADKLYSNLVWEFESGKRAIYADTTAFDKGTDGKPKLPDKRLYRTLNASGTIGESNELYKEWSPEFRNAAIQSGLDALLKKIEFNTGLAYGTLSDPESIDKTATEILSSKQRSAATVVDCQKALQSALDQLLYSMDVWADLNKLAPRGAYEAAYTFDDSLVTDRDKQFAHDTQVVGMSAMAKWQFLVRNYGLSEVVAKQWIADAQAEAPEPLFDEGA
jgi:A118 family predicted phage portal protein